MTNNDYANQFETPAAIDAEIAQIRCNQQNAYAAGQGRETERLVAALLNRKAELTGGNARILVP